MSVIRATGLLHYRELVSELGVDPDPLLRKAGVRPADVGDHEIFLSYRSMVVAMESAARVTATPDFGRRLALLQGIGIFGPVWVATRTAPTLGEALRVASVYLSTYSPAVAVSLEPTDDPSHTFFELRIVPSGLGAISQVTELSLGIALEVLRHLRGAGYRPLAVHFRHDPLTERRTYREYYGCTARFAERRSGFTLRNADLAHPVDGDSEAHQVILRYLDGLIDSDDNTLVAPVRRLVRQLLPTGAVTMDLLARQFALHPKTFQRRLADEGTTFGTLVAGVRKELTEHYLRDTDLGLTQVARELGYAEHSVLTRSCTRWYGVGPGLLRERLRSSS